MYFSFVSGAQNRRTPAGLALELFEQHQGTHILQVYIIIYQIVTLMADLANPI